MFASPVSMRFNVNRSIDSVKILRLTKHLTSQRWYCAKWENPSNCKSVGNIPLYALTKVYTQSHMYLLSMCAWIPALASDAKLKVKVNALFIYNTFLQIFISMFIHSTSQKGKKCVVFTIY